MATLTSTDATQSQQAVAPPPPPPETEAAGNTFSQVMNEVGGGSGTATTGAGGAESTAKTGTGNGTVDTGTATSATQKSGTGEAAATQTETNTTAGETTTTTPTTIAAGGTDAVTGATSVVNGSEPILVAQATSTSPAAPTDEAPIEVIVEGLAPTRREHVSAIADNIIEKRPEYGEKRDALERTLDSLYGYEQQKQDAKPPEQRDIVSLAGITEPQNQFVFDEVLRVTDQGGPPFASTLFLMNGLKPSVSLEELGKIPGLDMLENTAIPKTTEPNVGGIDPEKRPIPIVGEIGFLNDDTNTVRDRIYLPFSTPLDYSASIDEYVKVGDRVEKGQLLAYRKAPELEARLADAKEDLTTAKAQGVAAINNFVTAQTKVAEARIPGLEAQVDALETAVANAKTTRDRYVSLAEQGAVPASTVDTQNKTVAEAEASLGAARAELAQARAQVTAAQLPAGQTAQSIVDGIAKNDTSVISKLPPDLQTSVVNPIRTASENIKVFEAQVEANKIYSPVAGTVTALTVTRAAAPGSGGGVSAPSDPKNTGAATQVDALTLSVAEDGKPPAISVSGLSPTEAKYLDQMQGKTVVVENPYTGERGTARVGTTTLQTPSSAGAQSQLLDVTIGGKPLNKFDGPIAVYVDPNPQRLEAGGSSPNVALLDASAPVPKDGGNLPTREQEFISTTDVYLQQTVGSALDRANDAGGGTPIQRKKVGTIVVRGTVSTDGRTVTVKDARAEFQGNPDANTATTFLPTPRESSLATGGQTAGAAVEGSRVKLHVEPLLVLDNTGTSSTISVSPANVGASGTTTTNPGTTTLPVTLDIVPTGRNDEIVRIRSAEELTVNRRIN